MPNFAHLHCHTQYSLLDGAASIPGLFKKAAADGMKALAITDHGNMFGVFQFVAEAAKHEGIKPIVGCEFYVVTDRHRRTFTKEDKDKRYHQLFLAKNPEGYKNLVKLCSLGYIQGLYGKYPRIDKELVLQYHEGLIATTCCIGAMVPQAILKKDEAAAKKEFEWWLDIFGEDYYIEIQRHQMAEQDRVNEVLLRWAEEYKVKVICTNDSHYVDQKDSNAHDILLCVNTGEKQATPAIREFVEEGTVMKGGRFAFWNDQFYFKTQAEMGALFKDAPQSLDNTMEIVDKCEHLKLKKDILLPNFVIPQEFQTQDDYLRHITFEGARKKYREITPEVEDRLNFELHTVKTMGFAGYFLIVADFINHGKDIGVFIGPGRGSAAGSAVAYCIGITNIDPIKYQLLFERFLNPDRKSMPDIDTDFDDEGRQKVIDYVVEKYGKQQVAQIVTYGTMAAKMSIKDVSRVLDLPLDQANALAKLVPDKPGTSLKRVLTAPFTGEGSLTEKENLGAEDIENAKKLREHLAAVNTPEGMVLKEAMILEGSVRNTGIHAAGIIIAPKDLTEIIPVYTSKETELLITQYEGNTIEDAGVIKMDFLGLKTLTIIRDALILIEQNHNVKINIDDIPLDDKKTYELYQKGETNGTFQFESTGMQKYLRDLKPDKFDDLIAMNALYRPGPLEYIPDFISRKHGRQAVTYDLPDMEEYLKDTFGICVTGDTLIHDATTGKRVRIDQLEGREGKFLVQGVDTDLNAATGGMTHWVCNGKKPVFKIKLKNGATVKMTASHRVLTENGWREIGHLTAGEHIAIPRKLEVETPESFDKQKLRILAYLLADGSLTSCGTTADFVSKDDVLIEEYKNCLHTFERLESTQLQQVRGVTRVMVRGVNKTKYHEPNALLQTLRDWGLKSMTGGCSSETKFVPEFLFGLDESCIAFFIASYWDCDGYVGKKMAHIKTISPLLARDIQTLLLRLGIYSKIYESAYYSNRRQKTMTAYQLTVYNLELFEEKVAPHLKLKQLVERERMAESRDDVSRPILFAEIDSVWQGSQRGLMREHGFNKQHFDAKNKIRPRIAANVAAPLTELLELPFTKRNLNVRWEEIAEITPAGEELVYDITVEGIHNFVGNNIILHNCVYQEQIMLLSQKLAGFSKGDADVLRKAMGKKQIAVLNKMKSQFIEGGTSRKHPAKALEKIWTDWEAFAMYAFNKSHSTCYALVAYQTAYLKAHYPSEYMAAVLTHSQSNIEKITFFLEECKRMGLAVKSPDVNESSVNFSVNKKGDIRYGMGAVKGVGEAAVEVMIAERKKGGPFKDIYDFMRRVSLRVVNKRVMESLNAAGAFDGFGVFRSAMESTIEDLILYGSNYQSKASEKTLFTETKDEAAEIQEPTLPKISEWNLLQRLQKERDVVGIYLSGHPLDDFRYEWENFATPLANVDNFKGRKVSVAGFVLKAEHRISQKGTGWGRFTLQDYTGSLEITMFSESYAKFKSFFEEGTTVYVEGEYKQRYNSDEMEFKVLNVRLLETIGEEKTQSVTLKIPIERISTDLIEQIEKLCTVHKGKHTLRMELIDYQNKEKLPFTSMGKKVTVGNEFIAAMEVLGVECGVN
ncbi:MAG: DNA polymerase III subunit alpha [Phycisphaerae bacterium]|nr:DNA polymerase III subunit alpha [Saprospiraceae bacterium]